MSGENFSPTKALDARTLVQIKDLELRAKLVLEGTLAGSHLSPFHGYTSEFHQYRAYTPGDDLRHFDWAAYAKTDKPLIRQYRDETNTRLYILLDSSASMDFAGGADWTKWQMAQTLCAALGLIAYQQKDVFSLLSGNEASKLVLPMRGDASHLRQYIQTIENLEPKGAGQVSTLLSTMGTLKLRGSLNFIFSDFWEEKTLLAKGLRALSDPRRPSVLVHLISPEEESFFKKGSFEFIDLESGQKVKLSSHSAFQSYLSSYQEHLALIADTASRLGILYLRLSTQMSVPLALRHILNNTQYIGL